MSRSPQRRRDRSSSPRDSANDPAVYTAFALVGAFIAFLAWLLQFPISWREVLLGYCAAIALLTNLYAFHAYQGKALAGWQRALARLPLRCAGYGRRGARPLDAAHGSEHAKMAIFVSIAVSVVVLLILSALLIPGFIAW